MTGTDQARDAALERRREAHVSYHRARHTQVDPAQYDAGFRAGWQDAGDSNCHDANQKLHQRKEEQLHKCGNQDKYIWEFQDGYKEAFEEQRSPPKQQQFSAQMDHPGSPQCESELKNHRQRHIDYHNGRNTRIEPSRYDDGFRRGWTDGEDRNIHDVNQKYEERKQTHIQRCGQSDLVWEFKDGYTEAYEAAKRCNKPPQHSDHDSHDNKGSSTTTGVVNLFKNAFSNLPTPAQTQEYNSKLQQYRDAHVQWHNSRGTHNLEVNRYEEGFKLGWHDGANNDYHDEKQNYGERKEEHIKKCGDSKFVWEFEHGYQEAFKARRGQGHLEGKNHGGDGGDTKYEEQLCKHRDGHQNYHQSRNTKIDINIFVAGFKHGWDDKKNNCADDGKRRWRQEEYAKSYYGDKNLMWEFEHGYNEGCKAKSSC